MPFPTPSTQPFCLSQSSFSFLQRRAPSFQPALAQEAQPFTLIALHFATDVERIRINLLLLVMMCFAVRQGLEAGSRGRAPGGVSGERCLGDSVQGPREFQAFAILTMCRALYTLACGEVISKPRAAAWAREALGTPWVQLIDRALLWRHDNHLDDMTDMLKFVRYTIARCQKEGEERGLDW